MEGTYLVNLYHELFMSMRMRGGTHTYIFTMTLNMNGCSVDNVLKNHEVQGR